MSLVLLLVLLLLLLPLLSPQTTFAQLAEGPPSSPFCVVDPANGPMGPLCALQQCCPETSILLPVQGTESELGERLERAWAGARHEGAQKGLEKLGERLERAWAGARHEGAQRAWRAWRALGEGLGWGAPRRGPKGLESLESA